MSEKITLKPLAIAAGAALATSLAATTPASAAENPFTMSELPGGYMVAEMAEGKCGEGKCGAQMKAVKEGKCGEGKCGSTMTTDPAKTTEEGAVSSETKTGMEGKCGEGKCGANK